MCARHAAAGARPGSVNLGGEKAAGKREKGGKERRRRKREEDEQLLQAWRGREAGNTAHPKDGNTNRAHQVRPSPWALVVKLYMNQSCQCCSLQYISINDTQTMSNCRQFKGFSWMVNTHMCFNQGWVKGVLFEVLSLGLKYETRLHILQSDSFHMLNVYTERSGLGSKTTKPSLSLEWPT